MRFSSLTLLVLVAAVSASSARGTIDDSGKKYADAEGVYRHLGRADKKKKKKSGEGVDRHLGGGHLGKNMKKKKKKSKCEFKPLPIKKSDFREPRWERIIAKAFPPWELPENGCPRLTELGGELEEGYETFPTPEEGKFNPCYYTKAFAGLDPEFGGYPTPIDTHYPYEFAAPFLKQPGDGSVHHCAIDADNSVDIGGCPKLGQCPGEKDCAVVTDEYGIGHIPPFVPLAAIKNAYNSCDVKCDEWFDYDTNGCNIKKSALDALVLDEFGVEAEDGKMVVKFQPPILLDGKPSSTYYRLEYIGEGNVCDAGNCRGPHYCSEEVANAGNIWGDFCPYVETGKNSGQYRHPHIALAALELWIANQCMPKKCPTKWLDSPNGQNYGEDATKSTSITWAEMEDNDDPMSQPKVSYIWPNAVGLDGGIFPGHKLYNGKMVKPAPGTYVTEVVAN